MLTIQYIYGLIDPGYPLDPLVYKDDKDYSVETAQTLVQEYRHLKPDYTLWQQRAIIQMMVSPSVISMGYEPVDESSWQIVFVQKINVIRQRFGFYAPYLSKKQTALWDAKRKFTFTHIATSDDFFNTVEEIDDEEVKKELCLIFCCFWGDQQNKSLYVNFLVRGVGYSIGWTVNRLPQLQQFPPGAPKAEPDDDIDNA